MYEKINTYIASGTYILYSVCVCCKVVRTAFARAREKKMQHNCKRRRTAYTTNKKAKDMYISKREQKRRLQKLWHKSAEEQLQEYYLQQEKSVYIINTTTIERNAFDICKGARTQKRVRNTWSTEQAGTCGSYTHTMRFDNSYITKVCKSRNMF